MAKQIQKKKSNPIELEDLLKQLPFEDPPVRRDEYLNHYVLELKELHDQFQIAEKEALLRAILICAKTSIPMPEWLKYAFEKAYMKVKTCKAKSWDDVFGSPHPKNIKIEQQSDKIEKAPEIYYRIKFLKENDPKKSLKGNRLTQGLFEQVRDELAKRKFSISVSLVEKLYYYEAKKRKLIKRTSHGL
jgi:hypothetical protein